MVKVLVTGSTGFIGSHLVEALVKKQYEIKCLVRKSANLRWLKGLPLEFIYGDLFEEKKLIEAVKDVDYIYHIAGVTAARTKREYFLGNQIATRNLIESALNNKNLSRFVFASSLTAVGPAKDNIPPNEESICNPITTYGKSKLEAELEILKYKEKVPVTIVRLPAVFGPRDTATLEFFKTVNKKIIPLVGFQDKYISILYINDVIEGLIAAAESKIAIGKIYMLGSEKYYTWEEIGMAIKKHAKHKTIKIRFPELAIIAAAALNNFFNLFRVKPSIFNLEKSKDMIADAWICDITKAKQELGFQQKISLEEGIKMTYTWYKNAGWL